MPPFVSVIMPVYDGAFTLERALRSVVAQEFADWEIVAVDDGSTDDTWEILQRWAAADSRIKTVRLEENRGVAGPQRGHRAAAGRNARLPGPRRRVLSRLPGRRPAALRGGPTCWSSATITSTRTGRPGSRAQLGPGERTPGPVPAEHRHAPGRGPLAAVVGEGRRVPRGLLAARLGLLEAAGPGRGPL